MTITSERIRKLREKTGLSQKDVAKLLGVGRTTYVHYETGHAKPSKRLKELCSIFKTTSDYIMGTDTDLPEIEIPENRKENTIDLKEYLNKSDIKYDGVIRKLDAEDRQKLIGAIEFILHEAKKKEKRLKAKNNKS